MWFMCVYYKSPTYTGLCGSTYNPSCHTEGDLRSGQTRKKPKDRSSFDHGDDDNDFPRCVFLFISWETEEKTTEKNMESLTSNVHKWYQEQGKMKENERKVGQGKDTSRISSIQERHCCVPKRGDTAKQYHK